MSLLVQLRRYAREFAAVAVLMLIAVPVSLYIVKHQRLRFPWEDVMHLRVELSSAQAVTPGQGQPVTIAGVKVGEVSSVSLKDGRAVVDTELEPGELKGPIYRNATVYLRPRTGLNDMALQLDPGRPQPGLAGGGRFHDGDTILASNTLPNVNSDEVLAALDLDSRRYLSIVANAGGQGLKGRGLELRKLLEASQPTLADTERVMRALADRRVKLRRLVSNLRALSGASASKDRQLASLVRASADVFTAIGSREGDLNAAVAKLPGALGQTRRALTASRSLAEELGPASAELRPAARELGPALVRVRPLLRDATPIVRDRLRPLVREAKPLLHDLRPSVRDLNRISPELISTGRVLNYVANELGFNPPGSEEGYLFWTSWFFHNAASILSVEDAQGATWRGLVVVGCSTAAQVAAAAPILAPLAQSPVCPAVP